MDVMQQQHKKVLLDLQQDGQQLIKQIRLVFAINIVQYTLSSNVWVLVMRFCVCHLNCRVHWRAGRRPRLCRSTSALLLIGSTISSVGIGGSVLSVLTQFLSNRSQFVLVDGCRSKLVNVVSGVPQGSV